MVELTLPIIISAALVDSINPCVFGVLIFLLAYMRKAFNGITRLLVGSSVYIVVVYITYFLLGLGILRAAAEFSVAFYWFAASIAIIFGFLEVKDYFWYGRGFSLAIFPSAAKRMEFYAQKFETFSKKHFLWLLLLTVLLGAFVVMIELPCTGAPYFAILGLLSQGEFSVAIPLLLLYNLIFVLPLIVIVAIVVAGTSLKVLENWRKEHRGLMRLIIGLFLISLGVYMIYSVI